MIWFLLQTIISLKYLLLRFFLFNVKFLEIDRT